MDMPERTLAARSAKRVPGGEGQRRPGHPAGPVQLGGQPDGKQGRARPERHDQPPEASSLVSGPERRGACGQPPAPASAVGQAPHRGTRRGSAGLEAAPVEAAPVEAARGTWARLGQSLQLQTVAEGVEDSAQFLALRRMGCDVGQGYYLGRPMASEEISRLLRDDAPAPARKPATTG